jgi:tellurite resistance protein TerC
VHWVAFGVFVAVLLALDLLVFHRHDHEPSLRESFGWTVFWCSLAIAFNLLVWYWLGWPAGAAFFLGYVVEWTLSMDNVFVFYIVFAYFGVPLKYQYRVLFWGILGAVVMRLAFVAGAVAIVHYFEWVFLLFGAFLVYTGVKLAFLEADPHPEKNLLMRIARRLFPLADSAKGDRFFVRIGGRLHMTPLFLVLLVIESTDLVFAIDSVPAIIGVVKDWLKPGQPVFTFIAFTSNVFAILGLRALYFLLAGAVGIFRFLKYGLSGVLAFVGLKMMADYLVSVFWKSATDDHHHLVPPWVSVLVIFGLLGSSILVSILVDRREAAQRARQKAPLPPGDA